MKIVKKFLLTAFLFSSFLMSAEYYVCYQSSSPVPINDKEVLISYDGCAVVKSDCSCMGMRQYGEYKRECDATLGLKQCRKLQKKF